MSSYYRGRGGGRGSGGHSWRGRGAGFFSAEREEAGPTSTRSDDGSDCGYGATDVFDEHLLRAPPAGLPCDALETFLHNVNGCSYGQLKELTGQTFRLNRHSTPDAGDVTVRFIRIQPDPFAPGSQVCITVPAPFSTHALLHSPSSTSSMPPSPISLSSVTADTAVVIAAEDVAWRRVAAEDFLLRAVRRGLARQQGSYAIQILQPSQHVLPRSTVQLVESGEAHLAATPNGLVHVFLRVKLPGHGRRIDSHGIRRILFSELLPVFQTDVLRCSHEALWAHVTSVSDQEWLRRQLPHAGLVAFIADGAVLPRAAGDSDLPLTDPTVVPFTSPPSLALSFRLPYSGRTITGAGLRRGLTLIAGGGFHGKSTLLRALELGVYNHVPGDGRTFVVADPTAVKIRAEDRRAVCGVDISPFIHNLPFRKDTTSFTTGDASGSTSQAANIMEALELGSMALLLDEDTSATNFMYRDALMEQLVPPSQEPITSFVHRVRDLILHHNVSVVMVVGGSGQYFAMADLVLVMNAYHVRDATAQAKEIVRGTSTRGDSTQPCWPKDLLVESTSTITTAAAPPSPSAFHLPPVRHLHYDASFAELAHRSGGGGRGRGLKISGSGTERVRVGHEEIELTLVEQLVEEGQLNAIAQCLAMLYDNGSVAAEKLQKECEAPSVYPPPLWAPVLFAVGKPTPDLSPAHLPPASDFCKLVHNCEVRLRQARLELQTQSCYLPAGFTSLPRVFELGAALNRLRTLTTCH